MNKMRCEFRSFAYMAGIRTFWSFEKYKTQFQNCAKCNRKRPLKSGKPEHTELEPGSQLLFLLHISSFLYIHNSLTPVSDDTDSCMIQLHSQ